MMEFMIIGILFVLFALFNPSFRKVIEKFF